MTIFKYAHFRDLDSYFMLPPWPAKSTQNDDLVVLKHAEKFRQNVYTSSVVLAVWTRSTYLQTSPQSLRVAV